MIVMGRITYEMVSDYIKEHGTVSTHELYEHISALVPEFSRMRVTREVARKIRTLVKYRILAKMESGRETYVYLEGTDPEPIEKIRTKCDSIREYLETVDVGESVSTIAIANAHGVCRNTVNNVIKDTGDFVYDTKTKMMKRVKA